MERLEREEVFGMLRQQLMVVKREVTFRVERQDIAANCQLIDYTGEVICSFGMTDPGSFLLDCTNQDFDFNMKLKAWEANILDGDFEALLSPLKDEPSLTLIN